MAEDGSGTGDDAPSIELVGVIVGAICLFGVISVIPLLTMWYSRRYGSLRRRRANQSAYQTPLETTTTSLGHGLRCLSADNGSASGFLRYVSVEQWLREQENQNQHDTKPRNAQGDTHDICPICLSPLVLPSNPAPLTNLSTPEPALVPPPSRSSHDLAAECGECEEVGAGLGLGQDRILVLRCNHAFHAGCLARWFGYRQYKCPMCQATCFQDSP